VLFIFSPFTCQFSSPHTQTNIISCSNNPVLSLTFEQTPPTPNPHPNRKTPEFTYIHLLLLRLKEQSTDIMISINIPHYPGEYEKPAQEDGETVLMRESVAIRERVLGSFEVKEWGLFEG
jgi:hypothetical protein